MRRADLRCPNVRRAGVLAAVVFGLLGEAASQTTTTLPGIKSSYKPPRFSREDGQPTGQCGVGLIGTPCADQFPNTPISSNSLCYGRSELAWPDIAIFEADLNLRRNAELACANICLWLSCAHQPTAPLCVLRKTRWKDIECRPKVGPPACEGANEGRYECTATLTYCKCRCSDSLR